MNFKKIALVAAISAASFGASANNAFDANDFNNAHGISEDMHAVYEALGGDIRDFMDSGEGGYEMGQLLFDISNFSKGSAPVIGFDDDQQLVIVTEGVAGDGNVSDIVTQAGTTIDAIETDLFGQTEDFSDNLFGVDEADEDYTGYGLAAEEFQDVEDALDKVVAAASNGLTEAELTTFETEFDAAADRFNDARDGLTELATATTEIAGYTSADDVTDGDYFVTSTSVAAADTNGANIAGETNADDIVYSSFVDFAIGAWAYTVEETAVTMFSHDIDLPVASSLVAGENSSSTLSFTMTAQADSSFNTKVTISNAGSGTYTVLVYIDSDNDGTYALDELVSIDAAQYTDITSESDIDSMIEQILEDVAGENGSNNGHG